MHSENEIINLYLDEIIPNRFQPREVFDEKALKELAASIKEHGVIQPIIVRKIGDKYEIIAGERRYKASAMAGLTKIPAIVRNLDDKETSKVALLENLQRKDLSAVEEARTYQKILELDQMTQEELAKTMGKSQSSVANKLRLLSLPIEIQDALMKDQISERHARSLLNVSDPAKQIELLQRIISTRMTVRELESEIKMLNAQNNSKELENSKENTNKFINKQLSTLDDMIQQINNTQQKVSQNLEELKTTDGTTKDIEVNKFVKQDSIPTTGENNQKNEYRFVGNTPDGKIVEQEVQVDQDEAIEVLDLLPSSEKVLDPNIAFGSLMNPKPELQEALYFEPNIERKNINTLQSAIEQVRSLVSSIESYGFSIDKEEADLDGVYQITIKINKATNS